MWGHPPVNGRAIPVIEMELSRFESPKPPSPTADFAEHVLYVIPESEIDEIDRCHVAHKQSVCRSGNVT